jgi:hypothetical protein
MDARSLGLPKLPQVGVLLIPSGGPSCWSSRQCIASPRTGTMCSVRYDRPPRPQSQVSVSARTLVRGHSNLSGGCATASIGGHFDEARGEGVNSRVKE